MPELPEVETVRRLLAKQVVGKTVASIDLYRAKNIDGDPLALTSLLPGKTILGVLRKGKVLAFPFSGDLFLTSHLRMEGKYFYHDTLTEQGKHDILRFVFTDGSCLVYNDVRKFGRFALYQDKKDFESSSAFASLGEEPFNLTPEKLHAGLNKRTGNIKTALMDQTLISGIGNIYCDETLFATKINPLTPAKKITLKQCESILAESRRILFSAMDDGGSTVRSYHPGEGMDGMFQAHLNAYGKDGEPCPRCGCPMKRITVNGRGTTYCPLCQKDETKPFVLGITGPIHSGKSTVAKHFEDKGYLHFDADKVAKEAYVARKRSLIRLLGENCFVDGKPDYGKIRAFLAQNPTKKKDLEKIIHPYVYAQAERWIRKAKPNQRIVLDVPLLFPSGMDGLCDATIAVIAPLGKRIARLEAEGKDTAGLIKINAAYPLDKTIKKAGIVIDNDAGTSELFEKLNRLPF